MKKPGDPGYDPIEDSMARTHSYIQSIAQDLYSAEPNKQWKPGELLDEIRSYVELSNSLSPEEKALAQAQMGLINASIRSQSVNNRENDFQEGEKDKRDWRTAQQDHWKDVLQNSLQRVSMAQDGATKRTAMQDATRMSAEYLMQQGANGRAQAALDLRAQIAQAGLDDKEWADQTRDQLIADGLDTNAATRLFAAQASSAPVGQAPKPPAIKTHGAVGGAPRNSISAPRVGGAGAGQGAAGTQANPARPKTIQEAQKLPKGTYFVDPSGNVILKH